MQENYLQDQRYLVIKEANEAVELISLTMLALEGKRETLEEKMIKNHLHELAELLLLALAAMHKRFREDSYDIENETIGSLLSTATEVKEAVAALKKITDYNLNFLEQYFEHDYYAKLVNEYKFKERILETISSINQSGQS